MKSCHSYTTNTNYSLALEQQGKVFVRCGELLPNQRACLPLFNLYQIRSKL